MELIGLAFGLPFLVIACIMFARQFARRRLRKVFGQHVEFIPQKRRKRRAA